MSTVCLVNYPAGTDGFTEEIAFPRVPCVGESIELGIEGEGNWPDHLLGKCLQVKHVEWGVESPQTEAGPCIVLSEEA